MPYQLRWHIFDFNRRYKYVNKASEVWWGVNAKDMQGKHIREVLGEETYNKVLINIDTVLSGKRYFLKMSFQTRMAKRIIFIR